MFAVQKKVPLPQAIRTAAHPRRKYPFEDMEVGDMFFVPNRDKNTLATHASTVGKTLGRRFVTRLTHMAQDINGVWHPVEATHNAAVQGIGVWRTA